MSQQSKTGSGKLVQPDQAALVANHDGSISLFLPEGEEVVPDGHVLLVALALKITDPRWVDHLMEEFYRGAGKKNLH